MIVKEYFFNIECDCCKALADEELWHVEECTAKEVASENEFMHLGGKDYCPKCWKHDDEDNIVTKDGKVWDEDTEKLIREDENAW